jgi:disulfide bond formation protein DsbB
MRTDGLILARGLALLLPLALLAGALGSQYLGGLHPCEMCHWQRWPHYAAVVVAAGSFLVTRNRPLLMTLVLFAAVLIAVSGGIGVFHAGVEYHWWQGITGCTSSLTPGMSADSIIDQIRKGPMVRCDAAQWTLFGISMAGYNAILSIGGAIAIFLLAVRRPRLPA